jgi:metal-sulfur cluster biosynthetic enzyme
MVFKDEIVEVLKNYLDPEMGIDVWTLGFVRKLDFNEKAQALNLVLTLTSPMCPLGSQIVSDLKRRFVDLGCKTVAIELSFDPPWEPSKEVREMLGL